MSPLYLYKNKLLVVNSKLAIGSDCCCDVTPTPTPSVPEPTPTQS